MSSPEERARARAGWPSEKTALAQQREARGPANASAAWHAVLELTWEAWSLAQAMRPPLQRRTWPVRLYQPGERRSDSNDL